MKTMIALAVAVAAGVAAAGLLWQRNQALEAALAVANGELQQAQAGLRAVKAEVAALRKESVEQKMALDRQRAELATAREFLDAERAATARVREELAKAKEQIAFMTRSRATQAAPAFAMPQLVRPQPPMVIRAAPAGSAEKNAVRAQ